MAPFTPICLENGEWCGVVYHYGRIRFSEDNDCLRVKFEYYVIENPGILKTTDADRFTQYIGDILTHIIQEKLNGNIADIPIMSQNEMEYIAD